MRTSHGLIGFTTQPFEKRRHPALVELIASVALGLATIVTAVVVTAGVAQANVADGVIGNEGSIFAVALVLGLAFIGMGGLTLSGGRPKRH
jgi:uncharacterized membrane protein YphA (DoxX/SURF4 family)